MTIPATPPFERPEFVVDDELFAPEPRSEVGSEPFTYGDAVAVSVEPLSFDPPTVVVMNTVPKDEGVRLPDGVGVTREVMMMVEP